MTDTCQTPGCGHERDEHWTLNVGDHMDTRCCYPGCSCTAFLPPRPVPEEGRWQDEKQKIYAAHAQLIQNQRAYHEAEVKMYREQVAALSARLERGSTQLDRLQKVWDDSEIGWQLPRDVVRTMNVVLSELRAALDGEQHDQPGA